MGGADGCRGGCRGGIGIGYAAYGVTGNKARSSETGVCRICVAVGPGRAGGGYGNCFGRYGDTFLHVGRGGVERVARL